MKYQAKDIDSVTVEVKFKDGTVIKTENPATLLLSYQNFDMEDIEEEFKKTGKYGLDNKDDVGGMQILGRAENIKFALFTLLKQLVDVVGSKNVVETFNQAMVYIADKTKQERDLIEFANKKDKVIN